MALTATSTKGFERSGSMTGSAPLIWDFVAKSNAAITKGALMSLNNLQTLSATTDINKILVAASDTLFIGPAMETKTTTTNPTASETKCKVDINPDSLFRVTFNNHLDFACSSAGTTTTVVYASLADTADANLGGTLYCYAGTNKGESRLVSDYNDTTTLTVTKAYPVATAVTDYFILLDGDASSSAGIAPGSYVVPNATTMLTVDTNLTTEDFVAGPLICLAIHPEDLTMIVKIISHRFNAGVVAAT